MEEGEGDDDESDVSEPPEEEILDEDDDDDAMTEAGGETMVGGEDFLARYASIHPPHTLRPSHVSPVTPLPRSHNRALPLRLS